jgi:hypothetical protein
MKATFSHLLKFAGLSLIASLTSYGNVPDGFISSESSKTYSGATQPNEVGYGLGYISSDGPKVHYQNPTLHFDALPKDKNVIISFDPVEQYYSGDSDDTTIEGGSYTQGETTFSVSTNIFGIELEGGSFGNENPFNTQMQVAGYYDGTKFYIKEIAVWILAKESYIIQGSPKYYYMDDYQGITVTKDHVVQDLYTSDDVRYTWYPFPEYSGYPAFLIRYDIPKIAADSEYSPYSADPISITTKFINTESSPAISENLQRNLGDSLLPPVENAPSYSDGDEAYEDYYRRYGDPFQTPEEEGYEHEYIHQYAYPPHIQYKIEGITNDWTSTPTTLETSGTYTFTIKRLRTWGYTESETSYTLIVSGQNQGPVTSMDTTINLGESFLPLYAGGNGNGQYQFMVTDETTWRPNTWTPSTPGTYTFQVRKLAGTANDIYYNQSDESKLYTLTVNNQDPQPPISSQNAAITYGDSFWPATYGGAGTGAWQIKIEGQTDWQSESWNPPTAKTYNFQIKKLGDSEYSEAISPKDYILTVNKADQTLVGKNYTIAWTPYGIAFNPTSTTFISQNIGPGTVSASLSWQGTWFNFLTVITLPKPGDYTYTIRKAGNTNYNTVAEQTYDFIVTKINQANIASANINELTLGNTIGSQFTLTGGNGTGNIEVLVNETWYSPDDYLPELGSTTFQVRKTGDDYYNDSNIAGPYTVSTKTNQPAPTSKNISAYVGDTVTATITNTNASESTGSYQIKYSWSSEWQSIGEINFSTKGNHTFFVKQLGDITHFDSPAAGPYSITVQTKPTYNLAITQVGTGNASVTGTGTYEQGQTATITITENTENDLFLGWSGDISSTAHSVQILMDSHKSITATTIDISTAIHKGIIDFGNVYVDDTKTPTPKESTVTVTITNDGNADLSVTNAIIMTEATQFFITNNIAPSTIGQNDSKNMDITFNPTRVANINGKLLVVSNDPNTPMGIYTLQGTGMSSNINIPTVAANRTNIPGTIEPGYRTYAGDSIGVTISGDDIDADLTLLAWYVATPKGQTTTVTTTPSNGDSLAASITANYTIHLSDGPGEYHLLVQATDEQNHETAWEDTYSISVEEPTTTTTIQSKAVPNPDMTLWLQESDTAEKTYTVHKERGPIPAPSTE